MNGDEVTRAVPPRSSGRPTSELKPSKQLARSHFIRSPLLRFASAFAFPLNNINNIDRTPRNSTTARARHRIARCRARFGFVRRDLGRVAVFQCLPQPRFLYRSSCRLKEEKYFRINFILCLPLSTMVPKDEHHFL